VGVHVWMWMCACMHVFVRMSAVLLKKGLTCCVSDIVRISDKKAVYQVEILSDLIITITGE